MLFFIDPGHGGKDPGAIGQLGSLEKYNFKTINFIGKSIKKE